MSSPMTSFHKDTLVHDEAEEGNEPEQEGEEEEVKSSEEDVVTRTDHDDQDDMLPNGEEGRGEPDGDDESGAVAEVGDKEDAANGKENGSEVVASEKIMNRDTNDERVKEASKVAFVSVVDEAAEVATATEDDRWPGKKWPLKTTFVDEHTPIVLETRTCPMGSTFFVEAGAGGGKTTLSDKIIHANKRDREGDMQVEELLATTMTRAGVNELKSRKNVPSSIVKSLHSLGNIAIREHYRTTLTEHLTLRGITYDATMIRMPERHPSKHVIMLQMLLPPTSLDKEPNMPCPDNISAGYKLFASYALLLSEKALEAGFGQIGRPGMHDLDKLAELSTRYELDGKVEKTYDNMPRETRPLADLAAARVTRFGVNELSQPEAEQLTRLHETGPTEHLIFVVDMAVRLRAAIMVTSHLLIESVKVAMRPKWMGRNSFKNALDTSDIMVLPALTFAEMVALPPNPSVAAPIRSRNGKRYRLILVDEVQDSNCAQAGLIKWAMGDTTLLVLVGDRLQRCYSFASASTEALEMLMEPRPHGPVEVRTLNNNFRSARTICEEIQKVLVNDVGSHRIVRPVVRDHGEVIRNATLQHGILQKWLEEGTVAILSRLNSVLAAFKSHFLQVGLPFAVLGRKGVLPNLLKIVENHPENANAELKDILLAMRSLITSDKSTSETKDHALCLSIFVEALIKEDPISIKQTAKQRLMVRLHAAYACSGGDDDCNNAKTRGMPIMASGHTSKGHEFRTVIIAEPKNMMLKQIVQRGGDEADDETHLKYVLVSRAEMRLVFLTDVFFKEGPRGIARICHPLR